MEDNDSVTIFDYLDSDSGAVAAEAALQAANLPCVITRATGHWSGIPVRMKITVPRKRFKEAVSILQQAAASGTIVVAKDDEGLQTW